MSVSPDEPASGRQARVVPKGVSREELDLWRESLAQLRHLSDDVWKGQFLFLPLLIVLLLFTVAVAGLMAPGRGPLLLVALLFLAGAALSLTARYLLERHRVYYLQMLARKALLEHALGFYDQRFPDTQTDLALPWRLAPEVVAEIKTDFDAWVKKSVRSSGTIARYQFLVYEVLLALFGLGFVISMAGAITTSST